MVVREGVWFFDKMIRFWYWWNFIGKNVDFVEFFCEGGGDWVWGIWNRLMFSYYCLVGSRRDVEFFVEKKIVL